MSASSNNFEYNASSTPVESLGDHSQDLRSGGDAGVDSAVNSASPASVYGRAMAGDTPGYGVPMGRDGSYVRRGRRPQKLYRIGEIIDYSGLSRQTIHNYTAMGLIRESRWTPGGHRLYDESVFDRLDRVLVMKRSRKSIREIREHFAAEDSD